ncbi:CARDB domain-containing protein [Pleionea sediminis]|uniref:CARDB domain-containing protein n=1 Tax=Pleionea sediminis TaxID=2569479 RepID=UPI001185D489|nr:CARDB domain-containing protein [Pleionea sediminis]
MKLNTLIFLPLMLLSLASFADPIQDLSMKRYSAGWYPNFYKGEGPLTCPQTCEVWARARAESERSNDLDGQTRRTSVCKVTREKEIILEPKNDPYSHWLYGNQFDSWPVCHVSTIGIEPFRSEYFMCLCVRPDECQKPDLIVSKIYDPEWDHPNQRSVVKVLIANVGNQAASGFYTQLSDPGTGANTSIYSSGLPAGGTAVLTFYFNYWVFDPDAELIAFVDSYNQVEECKEDNNRLRYFKQG